MYLNLHGTGIIFAYSYNKFHATLTTRAQNTISAPTCVPETRFCCPKICGWDSRQPFVKSPGSSNTRPPCTYMKGKFPTPVNCLSGKFPGVSRGGMVTPGIDSCINTEKIFEILGIQLSADIIFTAYSLYRGST